MTAGQPILGKTLDGADVAIDLDVLIVSRLLAQANSGGGKSFLLRRILERTHGRVQQLILDIEGEFHTLREEYDYVLAAPRGGDTLADVRTAPLLARRLLELGVSAIIDLSEMKHHERVRFVRLFLEALIDAPRSLWHPVLVVVDEAHQFCPEKGEAESAGAVIDLMTRGRKRGYCGVLATQRLSKLAKDAAAEANVKLIGRAALDVDMKRAAEELGFTRKEDVARLRGLPPGRFFAFGPGLSDQVLEIQVGEVRTTHPKAGQREAPVPPPRARVQKVLAQLADLPKEAAEEARTVGELRTEVLRLRREVAAKPAPAAPEVQRVEVPVLGKDVLAELDRCAANLGKQAAHFAEVAGTLERGAASLQETAAAVDRLGRDLMGAIAKAGRNGSPAPGARATTVKAADVGRFVRTAARPDGMVKGPGGLRPPTVNEARAMDGEALGVTGPEQKILDAVAWFRGVGIEQPEQAAVALLAGYTVGGSSFRNARGALHTKGLIRLEGEGILLTEEGADLAHEQPVPLTTEELHRKVLGCLPGPEQRLLEVILRAYPEAAPQETIAEETGYTVGGSSFRNARGRLRTFGLIEFVGGALRARPLLFLEA
jgi:hypothetical protein